MHDKRRQSFDRMFGVVVGAPKARASVRVHKLLNSTFEPTRPIMKCVSSDFCERDSVDGNGETLVHWSCRSQEVERLQQLLADGYCMQTKNKKGETPLHVASFGGNAQCCQVLAMKGADVNSTDEDGWCALHWAVEQNNLECVKTLITHKAEIDFRLRSGKTALDIAVSADEQATHMMHLLQEQEEAGTVTLKSTAVVNKALSRLLKRVSNGSAPKTLTHVLGDDKHILLTPSAPKFRHLAAASACTSKRARGPRIDMTSLLNDVIQRKLFVDTDAIKRLIQGGGHAAMVYLLRSCDASTHREVILMPRSPVPALFRKRLPRPSHRLTARSCGHNSSACISLCRA